MLNRCLNRSLLSLVGKVNHDKMFCQQSVGVGSSPDILKTFAKFRWELSAQCTLVAAVSRVQQGPGAARRYLYLPDSMTRTMLSHAGSSRR